MFACLQVCHPPLGIRANCTSIPLDDQFHSVDDRIPGNLIQPNTVSFWNHRHAERTNVTSVHVVDVGVASVQLYVVHIPFCERLCINLHRTDDARIAGASMCAVILINTEFQAQTMNLVKQNTNQCRQIKYCDKRRRLFALHSRPRLWFHSGIVFDPPPGVRSAGLVYVPSSNHQ